METVLKKLNEKIQNYDNDFSMGEKLKRKYKDGIIFRRFDNDVTGKFPENCFNEQKVCDICFIDGRQPIIFSIEYPENSKVLIDDEE